MKLERREELRNWCVKMGVEFQWMEMFSLIQEKMSETAADSGPLIEKGNGRRCYTWGENHGKRNRRAG